MRLACSKVDSLGDSNGRPGLGRLIYDAILARDTPVIIGAFIVMSMTVAVASLATDLVYAALDPRVKLT